VCTANLYRSPLAAALLCKKLQADGKLAQWIVESAGTWTIPGQRVPSEVFRAARSMGIDLSRHMTRQVDEALLARYDLILVMERGHKEALNFEFPSIRQKVHLLSEMADGLAYDIADPLNSGLRIDEIAGELLKLIHRAYPNICLLAQAHEIVVS